MSAESPIELFLDGDDGDDDDDDTKKDDEKNDNGENEVISGEEKAAVQTFFEFTGCLDPAVALQKLRLHNFNVERAVASMFQDDNHSSVDNSRGRKMESRFHSSNNRKADRSKITVLEPNQKPSARINSKPDQRPLMSLGWYSCMANTIDTFVDPDFPPNQSSLDGRKQASQSHLQDLIKCPCGIPCTPKTVQSDGPNYGRFYLCCGKARDRKLKRDQQCKFFRWDDRDGTEGAGYATRYSQMEWKFFGLETNHVMVQKDQFLPDAVRQGAIGNCWFLSALAVVAEKEYLIKQLLPQRILNKKGCYQVNLCLDGRWTEVIVDSHLPVVYGERIVDPSRGGSPAKAHCNNSATTKLITAFCGTPHGQLWPALIEKAYAKAHGSYTSLSGGFIQEAFQDLTGAPTETFVFDNNIHDLDSLWATLMSFHEAGFLMGVATSRGGDGLVGGHAYSVLDVVEMNNMIVGGQQSMTAFLSDPSARPEKKQRTTIRLVRIRNPWGKNEWKGEWSADSDRWTAALRASLGGATCAKGDGTFFMSYNDMLMRFHHMDVAKCREGRVHTSCDGGFLRDAPDPLSSSLYTYLLVPVVKTLAFVSLVQPKKRANTKSGFWYADISVLILKRKRTDSEWNKEAVSLNGCVRNCTVEIFMDPDFEYCCVPISMGNRASPFRVSVYSASEVAISKSSSEKAAKAAAVLCQLHRHLLNDERRIQFVVAPNCLLIASNGHRCLYFLAVNASWDTFLSLRLHAKIPKGMLILAGKSGDTFDVPPRSQKILLVVCGDGTLSSAVNVEFSFQSDTHPAVPWKKSRCSQAVQHIAAAADLTLAGEMIALGDSRCPQGKGSYSIETFQWLSRIGSAPKYRSNS